MKQEAEHYTRTVHKRKRDNVDYVPEEDEDDNLEDSDASDDSDMKGEDNINLEDKVARSRERNRVHARRTRLRKKAHMTALQTRMEELKDEADRLKEALLDCQTANILVDISSAGCQRHALQQVELVDLNLSDDLAAAFTVTGGKKLRIKLPQTNGGDALHPSTPPNKMSTINWKGGYALDADGQRRPMSAKELDDLRRERNRMHAKMTRDRKKLLMASLEQTVTDLESKNIQRRRALSQTLTSSVSPHLVPHLASALNIADVVDPPSVFG